MVDVVIVGAGSMGMAAGYYLAKAGQTVVMIDSGDPPHSDGSHHGETRLIRHAYGEGSSYVPLALRAQTLWEELDQQVAETLYYKTGVLNIGDYESDFIHQVKQSADVFNLDLDVLSADEVNSRWPGFQLEENLVGCFESQSGVLMSERCIQSYRAFAISYGAELRTNTIIHSITPYSTSVSLNVDDQVIDAKQMIISAGKHTNEILDLLGENAPIQPTRKTFSWFTNDDMDMFSQTHFPGWAYDVNGETFYGFPSIENQGIKLGRHDGGEPIDPTKSLRPFGSESQDLNDVQRQVNRLFSTPMTHGYGEVCTYSNTPDGDFIIDQIPRHQHIHLACGFSGHGFKFSSVVGEILSDFVLKGQSEFDLTPFRFGRFN